MSNYIIRSTDDLLQIVPQHEIYFINKIFKYCPKISFEFLLELICLNIYWYCGIVLYTQIKLFIALGIFIENKNLC